VSVRLPAVGEYGLEIYACEPLRDSDTYTHICQYLVVFNHDSSAVDGQAFDRLDLADGIQVDPLPGVAAQSSQRNDNLKPRCAKLVDEDSSSAKDNHDLSVLSGQTLDRLDLRDSVQAEPLPQNQCLPSQRNDSLNPRREKLVDKDSAPAKDNRLYVRKEDTSSNSRRLHTSVCLPFTC